MADEILDRKRNPFSVPRAYLNKALEKYKETTKKSIAELEVVNVRYYRKAGINNPEWKGTQDWAHIYFTTKPKNSDNSDYLKHFLAELLRVGGGWHVEHCNEFEPSNDPGYKHDCQICGVKVKTHPLSPGYKYGGPSCTLGGSTL